MPKDTLRAFISYSVKDKSVGVEVKTALAEYGIKSFLAHDDLHISEEWKDRILEELKRCDVFVPLLSEDFRRSHWTDQETGIVFGRTDVVIIPLSIDGTRPYGFISHVQGKKIPKDEEWDSVLKKPLLKRFPRILIPHLIHSVGEAYCFRNAEAIVKPLVDVFSSFTKKEANQFAMAAVNNNQVWSASLCRSEYVPAFIKLHRHHIREATLRALRYQIKHNKWFPA